MQYETTPWARKALTPADLLEIEDCPVDAAAWLSAYDRSHFRAAVTKYPQQRVGVGPSPIEAFRAAVKAFEEECA